MRTYLLTCTFFWILVIHICASFIHIGVVKYLDKKQLEAKGLIFSLQLQAAVHLLGEDIATGP